MVTKDEIMRAVCRIAPEYPVRAVYLFGSYADGTATRGSDIDLYVEFTQRPVSFFKVMGFRGALQQRLKKEIDLVKHRPDEGTEMVLLYEA